MKQMLLDGTEQDLREVEPHRYAPAEPSVPPQDEMALGFWVRNPAGGAGAYLLKPGPRWAKLSDKLAACLGVSVDTLKRLAAAQFIGLRQPSPELYLLDLDSWQNHLDATDPETAPDFWAPGGDNRNRYLFYNNLGGHAPKSS